MKKVLTVFLVFFIILSACTPLRLTSECELIRIHIVANSDLSEDQTEKYIVRDAVKDYLDEALHEKTSIEEARAFIRGRLETIRAVSITAQNEQYRQTSVRFAREFFPTRAYSSLVVESGYFYALTIVLGEGQGSNWWCVIYPPLCYLSPIEAAGRFRYRSIIARWLG